jgi:hypothetical protein
MKKILVIVVAFIGFSLSANAQFNIGVKGGLNVSSFSGLNEMSVNKNDMSESLEQSSRAGFHLGVNVQYMFTPQIGVESGLFYSRLGAKITSKYAENSYDTFFRVEEEITANPSYLQLPLSVLYKFNLGQGFYLYPSVGLYVGCGIGGKLTTVYEWEYTINSYWGFTDSGSGEEQHNMFGENYIEYLDDDVKIFNRLDAGFIGGLTLQYSKFTLGFGYEQGFATVNRKYKGEYFFGDTALKNRNIKVSIGYFF